MSITTSKRFVCDSRDRITDHSFTSDNTSSDFVVRLPEAINRMTLVEAEIPLTYYVFNDNYNKMVFRDSANNTYLAIIPDGTYNITAILPVLNTAFDTAKELPTLGSAGPDWIGNNPGNPFLFTFNDVTGKIELDVSGLPGGIQFISIADPDDPDGITIGLLDGDIPGPNPVLSPIRDQLDNCAGLLGLSPGTITPNPTIDTDGFPVGISFAFGPVIAGLTGPPNHFPNVLNLSGEDYLYIKSDLIGISLTQQAIVVDIDVNENDKAVIEAAYRDRGIATKIQLNQIPYSKLILKFDNENTIFFSEPITDVNFRLAFRNDIPVDVNGVRTSFTIEV